MTVAVDTNILLDILHPDPRHVNQSLSRLNMCSKKHLLAISEIVYGELASQFCKQDILQQFLSDTSISLVYSRPNALWAAARARNNYTKNRTRNFQCKACDMLHPLECKGCSSVILSRQHILSDFLIGGNALFHAGFLLTRDRGFYK
ncbi:MAG: type II toxin-antitoxin system VapC family toxin [Bacillota bacterium]